MDPLTLVAILLPVLWLKNGTTDVASVLKGREAPSLEKFRTRHKGGYGAGVAALRKPAKKGGKEPGPFRQWLRAVNANTFHELAVRAEHKSQRRIAWYRETASQRDETWRAQQQRKLKKQQEKLQKFKVKHGLAEPETPADQNAKPSGTENTTTPTNDPNVVSLRDRQAARTDRDNANAKQPEQAKSEQGEQKSKTPAEDTKADAGTSTNQPHANRPENTPEKPSAATPKAPASKADSGAATSNPTGEGMYEQQAEELIRQAENIESYRTDLSQFADGLAGRGWGNEVTGPVADMDGDLAEAAATLRELAHAIKEQGDAVRNAYENAPYAPDKEALGV